MAYDIVFSGFGGQGALFAGQLLAYAAMDAGRFVTWIPSYGPEMRGGTAHCTVIVSDEEIGSPLVRNPSTVIALNNPSAEKYEPQLATNGYLFYNSSLVSHQFTRRNIHAIPIAGSEAAAALGHAKLLNMVMLGAMLAFVPVLPGPPWNRRWTITFRRAAATCWRPTNWPYARGLNWRSRPF